MIDVNAMMRARLVRPIRTQIESNVPLGALVRSLWALNKVARVVLPGERMPVFDDSPIPDPYSIPLKDIDMSNPFHYRQGTWEAYFKRLRDEDPVHYQKKGPFGPFFSITRYDDIMAMDKNHQVWSAEPRIQIGPPPIGLDIEMFIAMDPPRHDQQRAAVQGVVAPKNLKEMEALIRSRTIEVLEGLPVGEPFNWVERVSKELTTRMLASLLDYPYEDRRDLTQISDMVAGNPLAFGGDVDLDATFRFAIPLIPKLLHLWYDKAARLKAGEAPGFDMISLMQMDPSTKDMIKRPMELIGNLFLLVIGGNDTTRNSMSGGVYAFSKYPDQLAKLKANPKLIPSAVSEIIRWQTPLAYMRRVAKQDTVVNGTKIKKGQACIMWYASANRDERHFENPDQLIIDRPNVRNHLAFGFGIHRCMGNRLAEMQLRILWEELLTRFEDVKVLEEPEIVQGTFARGYAKMMVELTKK